MAMGQGTARPFIMENDERMDGWRPNPAVPTRNSFKKTSTIPLVDGALKMGVQNSPFKG